MAIYYIDPHTTTNGSGTWASPWSLNSNTRTGLAAGDEIRIRGVALTSLLTATAYTATVTSQYQLTLTAGGGLGADWVAGSIGYLPVYDTFFRVYGVSGNILSAYTTTSLLPIYDWSVTSLTVRKVDTTTYPASTTTASAYFGGLFNNITITDCWTSETTRVTDGTVKTLINFGASSANLSLQSSASFLTGWTVNCQNTAAICFNVTTTGGVSLSNYASNSTISFGQIYGWGSAILNPLILGTGGNPVKNVTINITHYAAYYPLSYSTGTGNSAKDITINITHLTYPNIDNLIYSTSVSIPWVNLTLNIVNIHVYSYSSYAVLFRTDGGTNFTYNLTGTVDMYSASALNFILIGHMSGTINIGSSVVYYSNKRASTAVSISAFNYYVTQNTLIQSTLYFPDINVNNSWTTSAKSSWANATYPSAQTATLPSSFTLNLRQASDIPSGHPYCSTSYNTLITFRNGDTPIEYLAILNGSVASTSAPSFPKVTTDATVYRTAGPSLKSYLGTKNTTYWGSSTQRLARSYKTIKVPCISGTSYTITGYTRTDDTTYVNGNLRVGVFLNNIEVVGQDMTTVSINAWEQFTLTFTAAQTAEYIFAMQMYYELGAKSYWLDDLTIN